MCLGIPHAIILTKVDTIGEFGDNLTCIFKDPKVKNSVKTVSDMFGVPENNVLPVKNYAQEAEVDRGVDILALLALRRLQHLAMDNLEMRSSGQVAADSAPDESLMSDTA